MTKIAINGFGRIGRSFLRAVYGDSLLDVVAINDLTDTGTLAYLLKYDSVYRRYEKQVEAIDGALKIDGRTIRVFAQKDPAQLPWKDLGIDIVIEASGFFTSSEKAQAHISAGAKRVVITAPATGDVTTALIGVNDDRFQNPLPITSNASCTTNSVAPVITIMQSACGVKKGSMATVHGYTATQKLVDSPDARDLRRGRAAAVNIVPSTTGAADAVIQAIPELEGKFGAIAIRVPTITGSLSITTLSLGRNTSTEEVNELFRKAAQHPRWASSVKVTDDPIVSSDMIGEPYGAIIDLALTKVVDGDLAEIFSWYDNEAGYTATLMEHVKRISRQMNH